MPAPVLLLQADDIEDYEDLHAFPVRDPDTMFDWEDDDTFGRLRLQGEGYRREKGAWPILPPYVCM